MGLRIILPISAALGVSVGFIVWALASSSAERAAQPEGPAKTALYSVAGERGLKPLEAGEGSGFSKTEFSGGHVNPFRKFVNWLRGTSRSRIVQEHEARMLERDRKLSKEADKVQREARERLDRENNSSYDSTDKFLGKPVTRTGINNRDWKGDSNNPSLGPYLFGGSD